jgi:Arc/MetJ-type ribon-helix-helix transcriptional regulator
MSKVEVSLPDRIDSELDRLVEQGEFVNRDQAVEELLSMGVSAYDTTTDESQEPDQNLFSQAIEDQQDPAARTDTGDDYSF